MYNLVYWSSVCPGCTCMSTRQSTSVPRHMENREVNDIRDAILHITAQQLLPELTFLNNKEAFKLVIRILNRISGSGFVKLWRSTDLEQRDNILTKAS